MNKTILGHIDCPTCGEETAMRITTDKNGDPFGFCEICRQQLRVGGDADRVEDFYRAHPGIKKPGAPVTETATVKSASMMAPAELAAAKPAAKPVTAPATAPAPAKKPGGHNPFAFLIEGEKL